MSVLFLEGFEKYGGVSNSGVDVLLAAGDWTSSSSSGSFVTGLSANGVAFQVAGGATTVSKTLGANYARLIGGFRFNCALTAIPAGVTFFDGATAQCSVSINNGGSFSVRNGAISGTALATSATGLVAANSTHYLEWDITFGNVGTGAFQLWLDGVSILTGSGTVDTTATVNNYANAFALVVSAGSNNMIWDDIYLFDASGTTNNAVLLTSPRVDTSWPSSDSAVQFGFGAATLGASVRRNAGTYNAVANQLVLRPVRPVVNGTMNSLVLVPSATSASVQIRPLVYADNAGAPGTLITAGSVVTGATANTPLVMPLTTPPSILSGTQYWIGVMCDVTYNGLAQVADASAAGRSTTATFASGAPTTPPTMTTGIATIMVWANITGTGVNWYEVAANPTTNPPPLTGYSYVTDTVVGHKDLLGFPATAPVPTNVYAVAVKSYAARSDTGARTMSLRASLSGTEVGGAAFTPGTTNGWNAAYFDTAPGGGGWSPGALSGLLGGYRIET